MPQSGSFGEVLDVDGVGAGLLLVLLPLSGADAAAADADADVLALLTARPLFILSLLLLLSPSPVRSPQPRPLGRAEGEEGAKDTRDLDIAGRFRWLDAAGAADKLPALPMASGNVCLIVLVLVSPVTLPSLPLAPAPAPAAGCSKPYR